MLGKAGKSALFGLLKQYLDPVISGLGGKGDDLYNALSSALTDWFAANGVGAVTLTAGQTVVTVAGSPTAMSGTGVLVPKSGVGTVGGTLGTAGKTALYGFLKTYMDPFITALAGNGDAFYNGFSTAVSSWVQANGAADALLTALQTADSTTGSPTSQAGAGQMIPKTGIGDVGIKLGTAGQAALYGLLKQNLDPVITALGGKSDEFCLPCSKAVTDWIQSNGVGCVLMTAATFADVVSGSPSGQTGTGTLLPQTGVGDVT